MMKDQSLIQSVSGARISILIVLSIAAAAITALGCAWPGTSHSVRFNSYQTEREMGRLPPLPTMANGLNEARLAWKYDEMEFDPDASDAPQPESESIKSIWERAEAAEKDANLRLDKELLTQYLKQTNGPPDPFVEAAGDRNAAIDRLDALSALDHGSRVAAVKAYLDSRRLYDSTERKHADVEQALARIPADANLRDNVAYLSAAEQYKETNFTEAAAAFRDLARRYPHTEKREAALFMAAVVTMKSSITYIPASGNSDYEKSKNFQTDQAWSDAFSAFQRSINEYPGGKYANDARSWQAYLFLRRHDRAAALAQYYRLLASSDESARVDAAFSLMLIRSSATDDEMARVENDLADEPQAALAYAYHNIYNYSIDPGERWPPYEDVKDSSGNYDYEASRARQEEVEEAWRQNRTKAGRQELKRTLEFSKRLMSRYPNLALGGAFALRAGQASEELDDNETAVKFAQRALQSRLTGDERAQALWTLGVAQHRLGHLADAQKNLAALVRDNPKSKLIEETRRLLAMIAEDAGDIDGALVQYIALNYTIDEAYLVDYLMTPEQLAAFIYNHPESPKRNEFTYALGIRYLRLNRWAEARNIFAQVKTSPVSNYDYYCSSCNCKGGVSTNCVDVKEENLSAQADDTGRKSIPPALLMRDIQTANDLEALERAANQAVGDEAKAETLYQYASYQYEASSLLFYNPLAAPGYYSLGDFAGAGRYRAPNEAQILFDSQQEHERLARALKTYLEVVKKFPRTRAGRDALYTAAVCHERLSNYNPYWREIYSNGLHAGERMVTYADVKAAYPNYKFPRGTYGWQPSTRTVNAGPGWAAPPKPPRRLTRKERLRLILNDFTGRVASFWQEHGKRWATESLIVLVLVFVARMSRRNHRRLKTRIARQRITQAREIVIYPWFELFWIDPEKPSRRERVRKLLDAKKQEFIALLRDRRSRPVLLRTIVSHAAVTGLVFGLVWIIWIG